MSPSKWLLWGFILNVMIVEILMFLFYQIRYNKMEDILLISKCYCCYYSGTKYKNLFGLIKYLPEIRTTFIYIQMLDTVDLFTLSPIHLTYLKWSKGFGGIYTGFDMRTSTVCLHAFAWVPLALT